MARTFANANRAGAAAPLFSTFSLFNFLKRKCIFFFSDLFQRAPSGHFESSSTLYESATLLKDVKLVEVVETRIVINCIWRPSCSFYPRIK